MPGTAVIRGKVVPENKQERPRNATRVAMPFSFSLGSGAMWMLKNRIDEQDFIAYFERTDELPDIAKIVYANRRSSTMPWVKIMPNSRLLDDLGIDGAGSVPLCDVVEEIFLEMRMPCPKTITKDLITVEDLVCLVHSCVIVQRG